MAILQMSEEEKKKILEKHKSATKDYQDKKIKQKEGLKSPKENNKS